MCESCFVGNAIQPAAEPSGDMAVDIEVWGSHFRAVEMALGRKLQ